MKFIKRLKELFNFGVKAKRLLNEMENNFDRRVEAEKEIHFEILPYSNMQNLMPSTRSRITKEASEKSELSNKEKENIDKAIFSAQAEYDKHKLDGIYRSSIAVFMGAWYCLPLRKYLTGKGYNISACGNDFDLWVRLEETISNDE